MSQSTKKLVLVLVIFLSTTQVGIKAYIIIDSIFKIIKMSILAIEISTPEALPFKRVLYIYYLFWFKKIKPKFRSF